MTPLAAGKKKSEKAKFDEKGFGLIEQKLPHPILYFPLELVLIFFARAGMQTRDLFYFRLFSLHLAAPKTTLVLLPPCLFCLLKLLA